MGRSGCPTKGGNLGVSLQAKIFELSPFVGYHLHQKIESSCPLVANHILDKKVSLTAFGQILSKILSEACILSNTTMTYLKKLVGTKFLITKQCPAGLSPRIIPCYPPKNLWETLGMRKNPTQQPKV